MDAGVQGTMWVGVETQQCRHEGKQCRYCEWKVMRGSSTGDSVGMWVDGMALGGKVVMRVSVMAIGNNMT